MAVIDVLPGVEVTVEVDGVALKEYEDTDEEQAEKTVMRYIEAQSNKEFTINWKVAAGFELKGDILAVYFFVDGTKAAGKVIRAHNLRTEYTLNCRGFDDNRTITKFRFSELETVSDGRKMTQEATMLENVGSLSVKIFHGIEKLTTAATVKERKLSEMGFVSEKALKGKALSHSIGMGATMASNTTFLTSWSGMGGRKEPVATFEFRYRSQAALKAMLIMPRTPSPPPLEEKDPADLTPEDIKELLRRAKEAKDHKDTKRKIKRERIDDNPRPRKVSRPSAGDTQLEIDDDGGVRESSTATLGRADEPEVIELD